MTAELWTVEFIMLILHFLRKVFGSPCKVIGQYIAQVEKIAKKLNLPIITGKTKYEERKKIYTDFRKARIKVLVVSKVANFAVDFPVMIQVSSYLWITPGRGAAIRSHPQTQKTSFLLLHPCLKGRRRTEFCR